MIIGTREWNLAAGIPSDLHTAPDGHFTLRQTFQPTAAGNTSQAKHIQQQVTEFSTRRK